MRAGSGDARISKPVIAADGESRSQQKEERRRRRSLADPMIAVEPDDDQAPSQI